MLKVFRWNTCGLFVAALLAPSAASGQMADHPSATKFASAYNWSQSPVSPPALAPGANTITLSPCPRGLRVANPSAVAHRNYTPHEYIYISGTGDPEAARIEAGNGHAGDASCTVQVTLKNSHSAGYAVSSATAGVKEASEDAAFLAEPYGAGVRSQQGGIVVLDTAGSPYKIHAPIYIEASNQVIEGAGGTIDCYLLDDDCMKIGDDNANHFGNIQLEHLRFHPNLIGGSNSALYVNANGTIIRDVTLLYSSTRGTFGHMVTVCDDQAFTLDGLSYSGAGLRNDAKFVGSAIYAPGPFNKCSAVGWLKNMNISAQAVGNGVDWQSGNSLHISDSVIQGFSQFGIRTGVMRGGYQATQIDNVYMELNVPMNPLGNIGAAGIIVVGSRLSGKTEMLGVGGDPSFAHTGKTPYVYWIVAHDPIQGPSVPLRAGYAYTSGEGNITVSWPRIGGDKITYDVLRTEGEGNNVVAPYATGNFAVATGIPQCAGEVCQATDPQSALRDYKVANRPTFQPALMFWPGSLVLSAGAYADLIVPPVTGVSPIVTTQANVPTVFLDRCSSGTPGVYAVCLSGESGGNNQPIVGATLMQSGPASDSTISGVKGRLNFLNSPAAGISQTHIVTLVDSDAAKTLASSMHRPSNDDKDTYIGLDVPARGTGVLQSQLAFGAPVSISSYIANKGDGTNWKERLTDKEKIFAVPVEIARGNTLTVGDGSPLSQVKIYSAAGVAAGAVQAHTCFDKVVPLEGLAKTDLITAVTPPQSLGNLSLNAYAGDNGRLTLHFCNPTAAGVQTPAGTYTFLAVH